ncbi:MAG: MCP four helix bundle domain-containing protein [Lachnospiraceae bacterium]|nr:MCP four helix bundle domain-containing protein [Lachnospiraceae bacterium]
MQLKERINYGYKKVIIMMLISGILSVAIIGVLFANMMRYVEKVQRADTAVKICRVDVNAAARNIREMALNSDTSSYDGYKQKVEDNLAEVDSELKILKKTGIVSDELYQEYASSLSDWGNIGYSIMQQIISGEMENATDAIINQCTPALDQTVEIGVKLDDVTDQASSRAVMYTVLLAIAGISIIVICLIFDSKIPGCNV